MKRKVRHLVMLILLAIISVSNVPLGQALPLEDHSNTTVDPNTGLEWLDLTFTNGISPNAVLGGFGGYVSVDGYRIATQTEVFDLFLNGGMTAVDSIPRTADFSDAQILVGLLGATAGTASQGWSLFDSSPLYIEPFVQYETSTSTGRAYPGGAMTSGGGAIAGVGVFLVREVPEPGSLILVGFGLVAFLACRFVLSNRF